MEDMTKFRGVEKKRKPVHHQPWFWAVLIAFMALSVYSGSYSSSANAEDATQVVEIPHRRSDLPQANEVPVEIDRGQGRTQRFAAITKLNPGLIMRLYEEKRLLYVNDALWKVISSKRRAYTIRAVVEYLDWVHGTSSGTVDVRSFRNGQRLMITG